MQTSTVLSVLVLGGFALLLSTLALWRRGARSGNAQQVWLMLLLAVVLAVNVAIWVVPSDDGTAPVQQQLK